MTKDLSKMDFAELRPILKEALDMSRLFLGDLQNQLLVQKLTPANQYIRHGFAWYAAYVETLEATYLWIEELSLNKRLGKLERLLAIALFGDYLNQLVHGIAMSQDEVIRPELLANEKTVAKFSSNKAVVSCRSFTTAALAKDIVSLCQQQASWGDQGLDETFTMIANQFHGFVNENITEHAQDWHLNNRLIPDELIQQLADLGVFGLTIAEAYGGTGLGKLAMCIVTEELSRGYIGVGSLGTRSEIAGELIQIAGTEEQKARYLPAIASGEILPVAVFTEPDTGSDLASLKTRAEKTQTGDYQVTGNKTWITHAGRSDLMTLLVRTNPDEPGHKGLTMLLAEKERGTDEQPFPTPGMTGGEIHVLGYRGMKEYEIAFDGFKVPACAVLGGKEGQGFRQLMQTFEAARIQTAARAIGVAVNAMELSFAYARDRIQFSRPIIENERIYGKLARMVVDITGVRQLTYAAARKKDQGGRCDVEAGMAKLLAARLAWSAADNGLQIHGGNGYSVEFPISRVLCDARILNIFEGAAEMQAEIIARGLLPKTEK
jgi:(2S)-methylsuccinyl-CoA dehydrogenase